MDTRHGSNACDGSPHPEQTLSHRSKDHSLTLCLICSCGPCMFAFLSPSFDLRQ
jgi:hypothetical protein